MKLAGVVVAAVSLLALSMGCSTRDSIQTTVGTSEAEAIRREVSGVLLFTRGQRTIVALTIPEMRESTVRDLSNFDTGYPVFVHALSGPDSDGRLAYIEDHLLARIENNRHHVLKTVSLDGAHEKDLFVRPGGARWSASAAGSGQTGSHLALSHSGGKVAMVSGLSIRQAGPTAVSAGTLEVWDIETGKVKAVIADVVDEPLGWLPDSRRLVCVRLSIPATSENGDERQVPYQSDGLVRTIEVIDTETLSNTVIGRGEHAVAVAGGQSVLIGREDRASQIEWALNTMTGVPSLSVQVPSHVQHVIACTKENIVVNWAIPGGRTERGTGMNYSETPLVLLRLDLTDIETDRCATILDRIDPREKVSFGRMKH